MPKWEYCRVDGLRGVVGLVSNPQLCRFTERGWEQVTDFAARPEGVREADAVAQTIAQLGDDGWEMVGAGNVDESVHALYFKRQKP